jgi:lipopolysaccharide biosynthesis regulator YciM
MPDPAYFRGLNYLLDDQPDKAIDIFVKLAEMDSESAEIHLALGGLFRRRGEVERAIRVHQGLVARPKLGKELRAFALYELGQDYMRAGLFDRAESLFTELLEFRVHRGRALEGLLEIYQQEKEWVKCMEVAGRLHHLRGVPMHGEIAQYHCELAEEALRNGDEQLAERHLSDARSTDPSCVRATMLQARMAMERGETDQAAGLYRRVFAQGQRFLPEIVSGLIEAYRDRPAADLLDELRNRYADQPSGPLALALADALVQVGEGGKAVDLLVDFVGRYADLASLERLLDLHESGPASEGASAPSVCGAVRRVVRYLNLHQVKYQCDHCGFVARQLHWQCPSCKHWGSIQPVQPPLIAATPEPPDDRSPG